MTDEGQPQQQSIDLSVLSLEQLNQMKTKHEEEMQALSSNFVKLRDAQLCDFGLARCLGDASDFEISDSKDSVNLTQYVASRWWRAPEVLLNAKYGTGIGVWSAGCIMAEMLQGKPLFPGSSTAEMLKLVVQFTGKPSKTDLNFVTSKKARKYVLGMAEGPPTSLPNQFPGVGSDALDLLARMLTFDPAKRISARDAMRHPWFASLYKEGDETSAPKPADLAAVENLPLTRQNLQQLMFEDVCAFHPECRAMAPGGDEGTRPRPARSSAMSPSTPRCWEEFREGENQDGYGGGGNEHVEGEAKRREGSEGEFVCTSTVTAVRAAT